MATATVTTATVTTVDQPVILARRSRLNWIAWAIVSVLLYVMYARIVADLFHDWWTDPNAGQGLLVPPLVAYIAWKRRFLTWSFPATPTFRGLTWIGAGCLIYLIGKLGAEFFLSRMSIVILLAGFVHTFWGTARLRTLAFPLLLLSTMVPMPVIVFNTLAQPLQLFASQTSAVVARAFGVSVYQDGNIIELATTTLGVEEACSGLRSLSALIVMALLMGFLTCRRPVVRIILLSLAMPIAILVNVLRVSGTAILADYNPEFAMGFYHSLSGWLIFLVGIAMVFGACALLRRTMERTA